MWFQGRLEISGTVLLNNFLDLRLIWVRTDKREVMPKGKSESEA